MKSRKKKSRKKTHLASRPWFAFQTALYTMPEWPSSFSTHWPLSVSQMYTRPSSEPLMISDRCPNPDRMKFFEVFWCPLNLVLLFSCGLKEKEKIQLLTLSDEQANGKPFGCPKCGGSCPWRKSAGDFHLGSRIRMWPHPNASWECWCRAPSWCPKTWSSGPSILKWSSFQTDWRRPWRSRTGARWMIWQYALSRRQKISLLYHSHLTRGVSDARTGCFLQLRLIKVERRLR